MTNEIYVYVDGSYGAHRDGAIKGGIGVYFGESDKRNASITIIEAGATTIDNQAMECLAVYITLLITKSVRDVVILSDSQHAVMSLTDWYDLFCNNGWLTTKNKPVAHSKILKACGRQIIDRSKSGHTTRILKVQAHAGVLGNERADKLAYVGMTLDWNSLEDTVNRIIITFKSNICNVVAGDIQITNLRNIVEEYSSMTENFIKMELEPIPDARHSSPTIGNIVTSHQEDIVPDTEPLEPNSYLFYSCLRCVNSIMVEFPTTINKKTMKEFANLGKYLITYTVCKTCIATYTGTTAYADTVRVGEDLVKSMQELCISIAMLEYSPIYRCVKEIYDCQPVIIVVNNGVRLIPVDNITKMCNNHCNVRSVDVVNKEILPYLTCGFLL